MAISNGGKVQNLHSGVLTSQEKCFRMIVFAVCFRPNR
jgi:hypothetical protein